MARPLTINKITGLKKPYEAFSILRYPHDGNLWILRKHILHDGKIISYEDTDPNLIGVLLPRIEDEISRDK